MDIKKTHTIYISLESLSLSNQSSFQGTQLASSCGQAATRVLRAEIPARPSGDQYTRMRWVNVFLCGLPFGKHTESYGKPWETDWTMEHLSSGLPFLMWFNIVK